MIDIGVASPTAQAQAMHGAVLGLRRVDGHPAHGIMRRSRRLRRILVVAG
jgi:hypothetical protein